MTKTKTKRTIYILLTLVVVFGLTAIFYYWKNQEKPEEMKTVEVEESITATDADPTDTENGPREYISEYFKEKDGFNAIGVSWEEVNTDPKDITFFIRTKDEGEESQWFEVYGDLVKTEGERSFYAAETPILVRGNEYQYKVILLEPENQVENIKFDIINTMGTSYSRLFHGIESFFSNKASAGSWNPANIISRNTWGGTAVDVSATLWPPTYAEKSTKFVVHHTVSTNYSCSTYTQDEAEADVRAIWSYHTYTRDWGDIGYNYLVDPCGRVFEGRLGGNNVIAGHAAPYNFWSKAEGDGIYDEASIGVSVMGDYSYLAPNTDIIESLGRIIGYKSYENGINPLGTSYFVDKTTYNIAGHRDYTSTACPGAELYKKLPTVRYAAGAHKNLYITDYGSWEPTASKIYLNSFRVLMDDVSTVEDGDYERVLNPAVGEILRVTASLKNTGTQSVTLKNIRIIGIYDSGLHFDINNTLSLVIPAGAVASLEAVDHSIASTRAQNYRITYELGDDHVVTTTPNIYPDSAFEFPNFTPHLPLIKLTTYPSAIPATPLVNALTTLNFSIKNYDYRPAYIREAHLKITDSRETTISPVITKVSMGVGESFNYSGEVTFDEGGAYDLEPFATYGNGSTRQIKNIDDVLVKTSVNVLSEPVNYSNIILSSFRVTMEDTSTPLDSSDYLFVSDPAIGEEITVRPYLRNNNNYPVTISNVRTRGHYIETDYKFTLGTMPTLTIPANLGIVVTPSSFRISSSNTHTFYLDFEVDGELMRPYVNPTYTFQRFKAHYPNVKVVKTPVFVPTTPLVYAPITGIYKLKNFDTRPAYLRYIKIRACLPGVCYDFPQVSYELKPQEVYLYSKSIIPSRGGDYDATAYITYGNGKTAIPSHLSYTLSTASFTVYTEVAVLEGIPIPATSGNVSVEQHLFLNKMEYDYYVDGNPGTDSASQHYIDSLMSTFFPGVTVIKNGMAGGSGAFGSYFGCSPMTADCQLPIADERYYINMRWNYTDLHDQEILTNKTWYKQKRVVVTNPANGKKVVCSVLEYGPGVLYRVAGLSPEAMYALGTSGINNDQPLNYYWAAYQGMPLGPLN